MGVSTNAIVAWGFDLGEWSPEDDNIDPWEWKGVGDVSLIPHCSSDYVMWFLGVELADACRGNPEEFSFEGATYEMKQALLGACAALGVEPEEGKLCTFSMWG